ncbi:transposase [Frigidibacter sp. MR17.14]|uniref:transposase n=1 Tax=Frigidibacter sp. MR17.14 TaxID=3126509 RepID=UPI003012A669
MSSINGLAVAVNEASEQSIWGHKVSTHRTGRRRWPSAIRKRAVARVAAGETIASVAREIEMNENLLAKWARADRQTDEVPKFVKIAVAEDVAPEPVPASPAKSMIIPDAMHQVSLCELHVGGTVFKFDHRLPIESIKRVMAAMNSAG